MSSDRTVMRRALDAMLPEGTAWKIAPGQDLDKYLDGFCDDLEISREALIDVSNVRNPNKTTELADLEIDFGVIPDDSVSEASRRQYLTAAKGSRGFIPSWERLENKLREAGYDVRVRPNNPPIDPSTTNYMEMVVNGDSVATQYKDYTATVCDDASDVGETTVCDDTEDTPVEDRGDTVGEFDGMIRENYVYLDPPESRWPFVFWICGSMTNPYFTDWNMEYYGTSNWTDHGGATLSKTQLRKTSGIRALRIDAVTGWSDPVGLYAQQLITAVDGTFTVTVDVRFLAASFQAGLMVCDKDGVWDVAGIETTSSMDVTLTYEATNGISGARLIFRSGVGTPATGDYCIFDNLKVDGASFTNAQIHTREQHRFRKMVLRYKPVRAWAALFIDWLDVVGNQEEDDMTYRSQTTGVGGTLSITDSETAVHIILKGTAAGYSVVFADARTFTVDRLYRFTNNSTQSISVENYDGSISDTLLPGNVLQATLTDRTTAEGDWNLVQHISGEAT